MRSPARIEYHGDEQWRSITPGYFRVMGIPVLRGRAFEARDASGAAPVVIVNSVFAKKYFSGADAIGQRMIFAKGLGPEFEDPAREIVGIVGDTKDSGLDSDAAADGVRAGRAGARRPDPARRTA